MIEARGVCKNFGDFRAVDRLDLAIRPGECFGLLGPNGAGKSTFIGMTYGTVERSSGELRVFGRDPAREARQIKARMGVVTQDNALDESLTVLENMLLYAAFVGVPRSERRSRVNELLEYMAVDHKRHAMIRALSGGMKRRLVFVRALLNRPDLLILDEPTTGLDPAVRHLLWSKVRELKTKGVTILLTTHYMHEAEVLCDRLVIMDKGRVQAAGAPADMIRQIVPGFVGIFAKEDGSRLRAFAQGTDVLDLSEESTGWHLRVSDLEKLMGPMTAAGLVPLQIRPANLEDVFLKLTGKELSSDA
jgi:lipooligosaccharide transport system ATP-binding protein